MSGLMPVCIVHLNLSLLFISETKVLNLFQLAQILWNYLWKYDKFDDLKSGRGGVNYFLVILPFFISRSVLFSLLLHQNIKQQTIILDE